MLAQSQYRSFLTGQIHLLWTSLLAAKPTTSSLALSRTILDVMLALPPCQWQIRPRQRKNCAAASKSLALSVLLIDDNCEGRFYDDEFFWPVFEAAQELDVAIYLHPSYNQGARKVLFEGNYPDAIAQNLALHGFGWHSECALHVLRLFAAKVFDHYPRLKIIIG